MLTLSQPAATLLTDVRSQQGIPGDALLRVAGAPVDEQGEEQGISLGFVDAPMAGDQTASAHGVEFCVAPELVDALASAKIDVQDPGVDSTGPASLVIVPAD